MVTLLVSRREGRLHGGPKGKREALSHDDEGEKEPEEGRKAAGGQSRFLLLGAGNVLFHVVQRTLGDSLLENQILQLMPVAAVLDAGGDLTEAVQEDLVIAAVVFVVPAGGSRASGGEGNGKHASCRSLR